MDIITVIIIALIVGVIVIAIAGRKRRKEASLHINVPAPSPTLHFQAEHYRSKYPIAYNPGVTIVETNSGFSEGLIMGSIMAEREPEVIVVETAEALRQAGIQGLHVPAILAAVTIPGLRRAIREVPAATIKER